MAQASQELQMKEQVLQAAAAAVATVETAAAVAATTAAAAAATKVEPVPTPTSPADSDPFAGSRLAASPRRSASGGRHSPYGPESGVPDATLGERRSANNEQTDPGALASGSLEERMASDEAAGGP